MRLVKKVLILLLLIAHCSVFSQTPSTYNSSDIYLQLKKLKVLGSVLYVAAHPDDENNALLPYLAKEKMYRTGYLSLTRGDGGQNLIGSEQGIELGMIRTQELLAARRMDGAEQFFSRAYEFGFSKSADESLSIWGKEKILSDVVWMIRKFQPDIIIARFPQDARAGHGHHWASAILANEAFKIAADPTKFPEQFKLGVKPWQAKRILWNTFNFGNVNTTSNDQLKIDIGNYNPLLGKGFGEIGAEARSMHKSQGEGRPRRRGPSYEYFMTTGGDTAKTDLMDGIVTDWKRIQGGDKIAIMIDAVLKNFKINEPESSVPALVNLYKAISQLPESYWRNKKMEEVSGLVEACSGLYIDATTDQEFATRGDVVKVNCVVNKRTDINASLTRLSVGSIDSTLKQDLITNQNYNYTFNVAVKDGPMNTTQPYWLQKPQVSPGSFDVPEAAMIGKAWNDPIYQADFTINVNGTAFNFTKPVQYKFTHPSKGELYEPFVIKPEISMYLNPSVFLLNVQSVKSNEKPQIDSMIHIIYKPSFTRKQVPMSLYIVQAGNKVVFENQLKDFEKDKTYTIDVPINKYYDPAKGDHLEAALKINIDGAERTFSSFFKTIAYDHIPDINYLVDERVKFIKEEVKTVGSKVGYIIGAGDMVPDAIKQMGYTVNILTDKDITEDNLKQYDAIITGIRAYNIYDYLTNKYDILMHYVQNGGNLIVQYNRNNSVGADRAKISPYPFVINSGSRVTDENAKVNFLLPEHPALNYPNKITDKDFENWVQERSTYQAEQIDAHYDAILGMNDAGEKQSKGSLIIAKYGKGNFVYSALVFFRELPAGVFGAYRLMANLIALPKHEQ
ncbi:PIG-L family deacetylase [Chitinophagaceae bacterium LWZ2-11]